MTTHYVRGLTHVDRHVPTRPPVPLVTVLCLTVMNPCMEVVIEQRLPARLVQTLFYLDSLLGRLIY